MTQPRPDDSTLARSMPGSLGAIRCIVGTARWSECWDAVKRSNEHAWRAVVDAAAAYATISTFQATWPRDPANFLLLKNAKKDLRDFVLLRVVGQTLGIYFDADRQTLARSFRSAVTTTSIQDVENLVSQLNNAWLKLITAIMDGKRPEAKGKGTGKAQPAVSGGEEIRCEETEPHQPAGGPQHVATGSQPFSFEASAAIMGAAEVPTMPRPDPQDPAGFYITTTTTTTTVVTKHHNLDWREFLIFPDSRLALESDRLQTQLQ